MTESLRRRVLTLAALASAPLLAQSPAMADQPSVSVAQSSVAGIAPGTAGRMDLAVANAGPDASFSNIVFTAPDGAKFADANLYFGGQQVKYVSCALSDGDATLSCSADGALVLPANATTQVGVDVEVAAGAAADSMLSGGSMTVPSVSSGAWSFSVSTSLDGPSVAAAPAVASGAAAAAAALPNRAAAKHVNPAPVPGGSGETNLVPSTADAQTVYTVRMLATEYFRSGPGTQYAIRGQVAINTDVNVSCKVNGQSIDGNPRWYRLNGQPPGYFAARWAQNLNGVPPFCS